VALPSPTVAGGMSLVEALGERRSVREFADAPLTLAEVSQLLWAAQGQTSDSGGRTAPSAGGLYPLEVTLVAGEVDGLAPGTYRYLPATGELLPQRDGDLRAELSAAALGQEPIAVAPASIVISGVYGRTTPKYGDRGIRFVDMEAGHAAQNVALMATAMGLGMVTIGALTEDDGRDVLGLPDDETPLYVLPLGRPG
jgi:SagB-type dehydrogenase family enzyme